MSSRSCHVYGEEWEKGDPVCIECPDEYSCRDRTLKKTRASAKRKQSGAVVGGGSNRGSYSYTTNTKYLLPEEGEGAAARLLKNMVAGGLSAFGGEVLVFFQEWRWPFKKPNAEEPKEQEPTMAKPVQPKKQKGTKPAKRIAVNDLDDDDELEFDLDDL